jgi:LysR family transcriptional regulator, cyn operon transcriptional activator
MELRHLRYFKVVAEMQHFHRAAEKLFITQPALSNQIKQLEEELNTKLFVRVGRNVKLSESGELVLSAAQRILNEVELLKETVSDIELGQSGSLKLGVLQSINALYLRKLVVEFDREHPNISLQIEEMTNHEIEVNLINGDIDIGIGFILPKDYPKIDTEMLFHENWKLIMPHSHSNLSQAILQGKPHKLKAVLLPERFETRKIVDKYFADNEIKYTNLTVVNSISSILSLVENGHCFSILPEAFSVIKSKHKLALFDLNPPLAPRSIGLLLAKDRMRKKTAQKFCALIKSQLSVNILSLGKQLSL